VSASSAEANLPRGRLLRLRGIIVHRRFPIGQVCSSRCGILDPRAPRFLAAADFGIARVLGAAHIERVCSMRWPPTSCAYSAEEA
jgi:hypothetical protein